MRDQVKVTERQGRPGGSAAEGVLVALFDTVLQRSGTGVVLLDEGFRYLVVNEVAATMNGLSVEAHLGRTVRELVPDVADEVERLVSLVLSTGEPILNHEVSGETPAAPGERRS